MSLPDVNDPQVKKDIGENKIVAALSYISILCLIPLILKPKSQFCKFHGRQGLILVIGEVINSVLMFIPPLFFIGSVALIVLSILGVLKALNGEYWEMPYLSEYAKKINI
ncbi:MAG: hypothetical protein PHC97_04445 [Patescibacteria group bacterium]|nr:hypothetical protein [Patescibacteria group bacterium]